MRVEKEGLERKQVATVSVNPVTAWRMLKDFVSLKEGEWFIQNGANSGVGRAAIQLGRMWGLKSINIVRKREGQEGGKMRMELQGLGANVVVGEDEIMQRGFSDKVKEWTNGGREKVGLGLNCVGGDPAMSMAKALSPGAHIVTYGAMSKSPMRVGASMLIFKNLSFDGFWVSRWSDEHPDEKTKTVEEILGMMRQGRFRDVPMVEVPWGWETGREELVGAVEGTLEGFRRGKGVFVFGDM